MTSEPYTTIGPDPANPATHLIIEVRGGLYSVIAGTEQQTADEIVENAG